MSWLNAIASLFRPRGDITSLTMDQWVKLLGQGFTTKAGIDVSSETALRFTTVAICMRVLGESVAGLPCILYRRRKDGGRDRATDHPLYRVLHDQTNSWNTAFEYFEGTMLNLASRGDGLAYIDRNSKGQTIALTPLNPDGMIITQARDWSPIYEATMPDNSKAKLSRAEVHHIRGPFPKGYRGRSMIALARDGIGLGLSAEAFGSSLFANGARPSVVVRHPKNLSKPAQERLLAQIEERHTAQGNWQRPLLLEEGMEWAALSINPDDAQFLETRKFQRSEIAGMFRVPAHLVNDLEKATFSNIEHSSLDFVVHSLRPWLKRWEQAIRRDLLAPNEQDEYFAEFLIDDLLRGDFKTRMDGYAVQIQNGIANPNEIRLKENMNLRVGGDEYWKPSNMLGDQVAAKAIINALAPSTRNALMAELKVLGEQPALEQAE